MSTLASSGSSVSKSFQRQRDDVMKGTEEMETFGLRMGLILRARRDIKAGLYDSQQAIDDRLEACMHRIAADLAVGE